MTECLVGATVIQTVLAPWSRPSGHPWRHDGGKRGDARSGQSPVAPIRLEPYIEQSFIQRAPEDETPGYRVHASLPRHTRDWSSMPRSPAQFEAIREESRQRILDAALRLFARYGYAATSVRRIAEEAGIAQGLLYNYFDSKEALLRSMLERSAADVERSLLEAAGGATPQERIERLVRSAFEIVGEHLSFWRLSYQLRMQPGVLEELDEATRAWTESTRARIEQLLRDAGVTDAPIEARVLFATIDGAAQHYAIDPAHYPVDEVSAAIVRRFTAVKSN